MKTRLRKRWRFASKETTPFEKSYLKVSKKTRRKEIVDRSRRKTKQEVKRAWQSLGSEVQWTQFTRVQPSAYSISPEELPRSTHSLSHAPPHIYIYTYVHKLFDELINGN